MTSQTDVLITTPFHPGYLTADLLTEAMTQIGFVLAMAAPLLWFITTWVLTRSRKPVIRLLWILIGLIVVLPWPFVWGVWS